MGLIFNTLINSHFSNVQWRVVFNLRATVSDNQKLKDLL